LILAKIYGSHKGCLALLCCPFRRVFHGIGFAVLPFPARLGFAVLPFPARLSWMVNA